MYHVCLKLCITQVAVAVTRKTKLANHTHNDSNTPINFAEKFGLTVMGDWKREWSLSLEWVLRPGKRRKGFDFLPEVPLGQTTPGGLPQDAVTDEPMKRKFKQNNLKCKFIV